MARQKKSEAMRRLEAVLKEIPNLKSLERDSLAFHKWYRKTKLAIQKTFGAESHHVEEFTRILHLPSSFTFPSDDEYQNCYIADLDERATLLESMIEEIQEYWEDEGQESTDLTIQDNEPKNTNEIFVIHGRDNEAKVTVARFLERLDLKPIILHEQSNQGRTIIEKFEQHAQVGFAVALLTSDDVGALQEDAENLKPRARQNVVFEFGYFIGRLGRNRVCALTKGDVEIPSDCDGVIYIPLDDAGAWKMNLVKELKDAGIGVDANLAL